MKIEQEQIAQRQTIPLLGWLRYGGNWIIYSLSCAGYLAAIVGMPHRTLLPVLLFTATYGGWILTFTIAQRWPHMRAHPAWILILCGLACASQFLPWTVNNLSWLPILPTITASQMATIRPRYLSLLLACILWLSSSIGFVLLSGQWELGSQAPLLLTFFSTFGFMVTISELAIAHTTLKDSNAKLEETHMRLQEYSIQAEELSAIRERNRIAREIHDTLGHALTLLAVQLETATQLEARNSPHLHEELLEARRVAKACLTDVRHSVEALRPDEASTSSLQEQLRALADNFEMTCQHTTITLDLEEATHPLNPELRLALYRCAQEALTNIRKHAHATKVLLRLSTNSEQVELTVLDNGQGHPPEHEHPESGFGLLGMGERAALLQGTLRAGPEPGHGWRVEVVLPLKKQEKTKVATDSSIRSSKTEEKVALWQNR